jgi:uncharacterized protein (TIGR00369 family)
VPSAAELAALLSQLPPEQRTALINANLPGFDRVVGLRYDLIDDASVAATLEIEATHLQPYGLVHGGVYATLVESVCSVGAALRELPRGNNVVGLENTTRFVRGTRLGATLRAEARMTEPPADGRSRWEATITDETGEVCATGRLTVAILAPDAAVAGEAVALPNVSVPEND